MRAEIVSRGVDPDRVTVVPNAVDAHAFQPGPRDPEIRARLGIAPDEIVVGYVTVLQPYEDLQTLASAVGLLRAAGHPVRGLIVGSGREDEAFRAWLRANGLDGAVLLPGHQPHAEIARWYRSIDVFVVPRRRQRISELVTPMKPFEAMATARPVVVSRLPALGEIVQDGETGLTYEPEDPADLAEVVARLIDDPALCERLGTAAREWVRRERTVDRNGDEYRRLYERLGAA